MPKSADCPHCKERGALKATKTTHEDTSARKVTVWKCAECGYTEGR